MRRHDHKPGARNGILTSVIATSVVIAASIVAATPRTGVSSPHAVSSLGAGVPLIPRLADSAELASAPRKLALIVAVSRQGTPPPGTRANSTLEGAANAADLMRAALQYHKFDSIAVIQDEDATRDGILEALEAHLINPARAGDVTLFYYAGHGGQIADDDGDEEREDRMDEVLVPYGAPDPRTESTSDMGQYYIRDDELGTLLDRLLARVGPTGQVVAFLDACHSGTGTRGLPASAGSLPQGAASNSYVGSGYHEPRNQTDGVDQTTGETGFITLSAGRQFDEVIEIWHTDGRLVSPLAHALDWALPKLGPGSSFRDLHDLVTEAAHAKNWHHPPQIEGPATQVVFNALGTHYQPWVPVDSIMDSLTLRVSGGELHGLRENSTVELHSPGSPPTLAPESLWAHGIVTSASALSATIRLESPPPTNTPTLDGRVYLTRADFGHLKTRVEIHEAVDRRIAELLSETLSQSNVVSIVPQGGTLAVRQQAQDLWLHTLPDSVLVGQPVSAASDTAAHRLANDITAYSRFAYLRGLQFHDPNVNVSLRLLPASGDFSDEHCHLTADTVNVGPGVWPASQGADWELLYSHYSPPSDERFFLVEITNMTDRAVYVAAMEYLPDGEVILQYPSSAMAPSAARLGPNADPFRWCFRLNPVVRGLTVFKLFATDAAVDFRPYLGAATARDALRARGNREPQATNVAAILMEMFDDGSGVINQLRTRSRGWRRPTRISTSSVSLRIVPD